ncbi:MULTISPECIES: hypothetical protein [Bacillaceae]|uniref:Uncharacterized protein n=1 Tax=Evansella alkalicola TaxID=745819 RepID=A0ABS6JYT7_9BACI|nr:MULTISPECIES: hypothetical protein [Bacillaceae]MBU9723748.1 hypothetical protein [Bacillus alkalicola]
MALDEPEENDEVNEINGVQVAIDPVIKAQTEGITLDYEERGGQGGLLFKGVDDCC